MALNNRSYSCSPKQLRAGKKYHYSIFYNYYEGPSSGRRGDHLLSWNFLNDLKAKLSEIGYDKVMYHDIARPGSNIFDNLFSMVNESEKIVVLLTPEYIQNGWHKYSGQAVIKNLFDKHETHSRFIPIAINIKKEDIPDNFGLSVSKFICTGYEKNSADEGFWDKIKGAFGPTELHYEQTEHLYKSCNLSSMVPPEIRIPHGDFTEGMHNCSLDG